MILLFEKKELLDTVIDICTIVISGILWIMLISICSGVCEIPTDD